MLSAYFEFLLRRPITWMLILVSITLFTASGMLKLTFTSDFRSYFSSENPQLQAFEDMERRFSKQDNLFLLISSEQAELFSQQGLSLIEELTNGGWQLEHVQRVDSLQNFQYTDVQGDELIVDDFYRIDELEISYESLKQKAINHPDILSKLISTDGKVAGISLTLHLPDGKTSSASKEAVASANAMLSEIRPRYPDFKVEMGGSAYMNITMGVAIKKDISTLVVACYGVMLVIMLLLLRTLSGVFLTSALIGITVGFSMGAFGWMGYTLTPPTGFVPTGIMTIAIADAIHILVSYYYLLRQGDDKRTALLGSMKINAAPIFITSITTAIGLLALNTSDSPPYRDMGNMVALGVMIAWALSMSLFPLAIWLLPAPITAAEKDKKEWIDELANWIIKYNKPLLIIFPLIVVSAVTLINRNVITERWHSFFDNSYEVRQTVDHVEQTLESLHALYFVADSKIEDGVNQVDFLQQLNAFSEWLKAQPEVVTVTSLANTLKRLNQNLHEDNPEWYRIPDTAEAAAQYLLLYELSLPKGLGLDNTLTYDRKATRIQVTLRRTDSAAIMAIEERAIKWAQANAPLLNIDQATGLDTVFANLTYRNIKSMMDGTVFALVMISVLMIITLRSFRIGFISMVPNILPALLAYSIWGLTKGYVDTATSVVACLSLGIVVDDTVHFLSKYNHARKQLGKTVEEAIRYAFRTVGIALLITSVILVGGFMVTELSHFSPTRDMGQLLALTITVALFIDFFLLPALLLLLDKRKFEPAPEEAAQATKANAPKVS